jgi:hypothetical protein
MPSIVNPGAQAFGLAALAVVLLCLSTAILRADDSRPAKPGDAGALHCRMYFGCLPDLAKVRGRLN